MILVLKSFLFMLLAWGLSFSQANSEPETVVGSSYSIGGDRYHLRATLRWTTSSRFGPDTVVMHFSVYRNDTVLLPLKLDGGILLGGTSGRNRPIESEVNIQVLEGVGWQVKLGAIRGSTFSDYYTFILPSGPASMDYLQSTFIAKYAPTIRRKGDTIEIWSCYQEWGGGGTAFSFFVPELRIISRENGRVRLNQQPLPSDSSLWPELEYVGPFGKFVAGLSQLNPELMDSVNRDFNSDDTELLRYHELPLTPEGRQQLIETVRRAATLRKQYDRFELHWERLY
jgi:hypothetical protein